MDLIEKYARALLSGVRRFERGGVPDLASLPEGVQEIAIRSCAAGRARPDPPGESRPRRRDASFRGFRRETAPGAAEDGAKFAVVDLRWTVGSTVRRYEFNWQTWAWDAYDQNLSLDDGAVKLERLNNGAPFLRVHRSDDTEDVLGVLVTGSATWQNASDPAFAREGVATVRFSRRESVQPVVQDVEAQILRNISVGFNIHRTRIEERTNDVPLHTAIEWEPFELSLVPMGADDAAKTMFRSLGGGFDPPRNVRSQEAFEMTKIRVPACHTLRVLADGATEIVASEGATGGLYEIRKVGDKYEAVLVEAAADTPEAIAAKGAKDERERAATIRLRGKSLHLAEAVIEACVVNGYSVEKATDHFHRVAADAPGAAGTSGSQGTIGVGDEKTERAMAEGMTLAIAYRANPGNAEIRKEFDADVTKGGYAGHFAHMTWSQLAEFGLARHGVKFVRAGVRMSPGQIADAALWCDDRTVGRLREVRSAAGGIATSDLPNIMADAVHKVMRRAYESRLPTFPLWATKGTLKDFRPHNFPQLSDAPSLLEIGDGGEIERGTMRDSGESMSLREFARLLAITRRTITNDDLDAFGRVPAGFALKARSLETNVVYSVLTDNDAMGDGVALFHADHGNLGTAGAPDAAGKLAEIRPPFRKAGSQSAEAGEAAEVLNLTPSYLIGPSDVEEAFDKALSDKLFAATIATVNPEALRRLFTPVIEPFLDATSITEYYAAINPATMPVDTVMYAYLTGEEGLQMATRIGFEVMGVEIRAHMTFAAKALDHRGLVKMPG